MLESNPDPYVSQNFEFRTTTRYDLEVDLPPFSYLRRLQNNNTSDSLKACYQTPILTVYYIIVREKELFLRHSQKKNYFLVTMVAYDIIYFLNQFF